jgi:hypothetical protein
VRGAREGNGNAGGGAPGPLRILFNLAYPGYLRYYDSVLLELAARGHHVELWFDNLTKQPEGLEALRNEPRIEVKGKTPKRRDPAGQALRQARATADYVRYLDPRFRDAHYLRERTTRLLPRPFAFLARFSTAPQALVQLVLKASLALEQVAPCSSELDRLVADRRPDVVVAAPYVYIANRQIDLLASAKAAGARTIAAIASWDNLTTKGLVRGCPDRVFMWNEAQRREAVELHFVPAERVVLTGAPAFDKWFGREPTRNRAEFLERVGLDDRPYVLFVGSTESISAPTAEYEFVRGWITAMRASDDPCVRNLGVLVRPHPYNSLHWSEADLGDLCDTAVWPRGGANPVNAGDRADYFDSIYHSCAVVGINTSAMLESAIVGRPVFTITPPDFAESQAGTLHFRHLMPDRGGFVERATSTEEHLAQLSTTLGDISAAQKRLERFVATFIRPCGIDRAATAVFADELEALAEAPIVQPEPATPVAHAALLFFRAVDWFDELLRPKRLSRMLRRRGRHDRARFEQLGKRVHTQAKRAASAETLPPPIAWRTVGAARRVRRALESSGDHWQQTVERVATRIEARDGASDGDDTG